MTDFEALLGNALSDQAASIDVTGNLDAVVAEGRDDPEATAVHLGADDGAPVEHETISTPPRSGRLLIGLAAVIALVVGGGFVASRLESGSGVITNPADSPLPPLPTLVVEPEPGLEEGPVEDPNVGTDDVTEQGDDFDLVIWMRPDATSPELEAVGATLESTLSIASFTYSSQESAFEEFQELFEDSPELVEAVVAQDLPSRFNIVLKEDASPSEVAVLRASMAEMAGVRDVMSSLGLNGLDEFPDPLVDLRECESSGDFTAISVSGQYRGAYQLTQSTWDLAADAYYPEVLGVDPIGTSPEVQDAIALALTRIQSPELTWPKCAEVAGLMAGGPAPVFPADQAVKYGIADQRNGAFTLKVDGVGLVPSSGGSRSDGEPDEEIADITYISPYGPTSSIVWRNVPAEAQVVVLESGSIRFWQRPYRRLIALPYPEGASIHFELIAYDAEGREVDRQIYNVPQE